MQSLISIGRITKNTYEFREHVHSKWEGTYYYHGEGVNRFGSRDIKFSPGTFILQPPGIPHHEMSENGFMNIYFTLNNCGSYNEDIPVFRDTAGNDIFSLLSQIHIIFNSRRNNYNQICDALLKAIHEILISMTSSINYNPYVELLENILISNISTAGFQIGDAMNGIPVCRDYLRRIFKKNTGVTPVEYLNNLRVNYAKSLLDKHDVHINHIAGLSGFDDPYYFSRVFKRFTGTAKAQTI